MKTKLIIVLILLSSNFSYAQIVKGISIKSGVSLSNQDWTKSYYSYNRNFDVLPGFYSAITVDFINKTWWELSADIGYYQSCSKNVLNLYSMDIHDPTPDVNLRFGFITLSPVLKLKTQLKAFTPYLLLGPRLDYYVADLSNEAAKYYKDGIQNAVWGLTIGEGVAYKFKNISLFAEYQYFYCFTDMMNQAPFFVTTDYDRDRVKTNTHIISLGVKYHIKHEQ